jgi:DNA replication protein DnaC
MTDSQRSSSPNPSCPECNGTGWLRYAERKILRRDADNRIVRDSQGNLVFDVVELKRIDPRTTRLEFMARYPDCRDSYAQCECVSEQLRERRIWRLGMAEMPDSVYRHSFADFEHYPEVLYCAQLLAGGQAIPTTEGVDKYGLLLTGPLGTGKTTLGSLIYMARLQALKSAAWCRYVSLMTRITDTYKEGYIGASVNDIMQDVMGAPFLMLDEVGNLNELESGTSASRHRNEHLLTIIDYRYAHHLPTVLTTNLSIAQLYVYFDPAIVSRIRGLCVAGLLDGNDHRTGEEQRS